MLSFKIVNESDIFRITKSSQEKEIIGSIYFPNIAWKMYLYSELVVSVQKYFTFIK